MATWTASVHHVHLMAADLDASLTFYQRWFGAEIVADFTYAGARNVAVQIGQGRLNFYDQAPKGTDRNAFNHIGLVVYGLEGLADAMTEAGVHLPKPVQRFDDGSYLMVEAPDRVLLELFEPNPNIQSPKLRQWFDLDHTGS